MVKQSEDNCVLTKNGDQQNSQDALLGDACNPTLSTNSSNGQAIQV
ncbi:MAG: hypothetical protein Q8O99_00500 [bacterium]|nr:hypothetical protein [bacterium]